MHNTLRKIWLTAVIILGCLGAWLALFRSDIGLAQRKVDGDLSSTSTSDVDVCTIYRCRRLTRTQYDTVKTQYKDAVLNGSSISYEEAQEFAAILTRELTGRGINIGSVSSSDALFRKLIQEAL